MPIMEVLFIITGLLFFSTIIILIQIGRIRLSISKELKEITKELTEIKDLRKFILTEMRIVFTIIRERFDAQGENPEKKLEYYIRNSMQKGATREELTKKLKQTGWSKSSIDNVFDKIKH
jgi:hypothetical protein